MSNAYDPTSKDFRGLRKSVAKQRKIYETRYRDIRDKIFAHKEISHPDDTNALFKKTKIEEMKALFAFLHALHEALLELLFNGREPTLKIGDFVLPPAPKISGRSQNPGEEIAYEIAEFVTGGTDD